MLIATERAYRYRRDGAGEVGDDGRWRPASFVRELIIASIQPLSPFEIQALPEGERTRRNWWLYTKSDVRILDHQNGLDADVVEVDGIYYEVREVHHYRAATPIPHKKVRVLEIIEGSEILQDLP